MQEDNVVRGFECGINDYLLKPFGRQELLARVRAHLQFKDGVLRVGVFLVAWGYVSTVLKRR